MLIVSDNVFRICCYCTVNKLVVVWIGCYQSKMDIDLLIISRTQSRNGLNNVTGNFLGCFRSQNFFVFTQYFRIDT